MKRGMELLKLKRTDCASFSVEIYRVLTAQMGQKSRMIPTEGNATDASRCREAGKKGPVEHQLSI